MIETDWGLLVIDLQNDFLDRRGYYGARRRLEGDPGWRELPPGEQARRLEEAAAASRPGLISRDAERVVSNVTRAVHHARRARRPIAFVRAVYDRSHDVLPPRLRSDPDRRHFPCRPDTWGVEFVDPIRRVIAAGRSARERVVDKHTYDAFFSNPALESFLTGAAVKSLVVCGTETQTCVLVTAQHAALLGYRTTILEDGVWSANAQLGEAALAIFRGAFGETCDLKRLIS